jgi:hypothetical protein
VEFTRRPTGSGVELFDAFPRPAQGAIPVENGVLIGFCDGVSVSGPSTGNADGADRVRAFW